MSTASIRISQSEYDEIKNHEYVVVREWEEKDIGRRFGTLMSWGSEEECKTLVNESYGFVVVPNHLEYISDQAIAVEDLIGGRGR